MIKIKEQKISDGGIDREYFAITGPKGCGKSTYKNFLGGKKLSIPVLINKCLGINDLSINVKDHISIKNIHKNINGFEFQRQVSPTAVIEELTASMNLEFCPQTKKIVLIDFPGEIMNDVDEKENAMKELEKCQYILFFVPFWFLLRDDLLSSNAKRIKDYQMIGYSSWTQAFNEIKPLSINAKKRELIVVLNMFGHRWFDIWLNKNLDRIKRKDYSVKEVYDSLSCLDRIIYSLEKLELIQENPWISMSQYMFLIRKLEKAVLHFVNASHNLDGHNNTDARRLLNISQYKYRKTFMSINVIDNFKVQLNNHTYHLLHNTHRLAYLPLLYLLHGFTQNEVW